MRLLVATADALQDDVPPGFQFLVTEDMELVEPANLYLFETCVVNGKVESFDTQRTYAEGLYDWFQTCEDNAWHWDQVTEYEIALYRNRMCARPSPATNRPYALRTINQRVGEVCRFYTWAFQRKLIGQLPFQGYHLQIFQRAWGGPLWRGRGPMRTRNPLLRKHSKAVIKNLTSAQLQAIFDNLGPDRERPSRNRLMAEAAVVMGLRRMEVCGLTLRQIPNPQVGLGKIILEVTKGGRERAVYPPAAFLDRLHWYIAVDRARAVGKLKKKLGNAYKEPKEVFIAAHGGPMDRKYLSMVLRCAADSAEVHGATFHSLRHTFALSMFKQLQRHEGVNPWKALQVILGHRQMATTVDIYLEALEVNEPAIADSVERLYEAALAAVD